MTRSDVKRYNYSNTLKQFSVDAGKMKKDNNTKIKWIETLSESASQKKLDI